MRSNVIAAEQFHQKMNVLHESGYFVEEDDGQIRIVDDLKERENLKEQHSSKKKTAMMQANTNRRQAQNFGGNIQMHEQEEDSSTMFQNV